jgi:hypothetical protein
MPVFTEVLKFLQVGVGEKIAEAVSPSFPPSLNEAEKKKLEAAIRKAARDHEVELLETAKRESEEFNLKIKDMEGTAKDLKEMGWPGKIIVFLRGAQRPIWGYVVLFLDIQVFSGRWDLAVLQENSESAQTFFNLADVFWIINALVLGFLFGERAVRNVIPLVQGRFGGKKAEG